MDEIWFVEFKYQDQQWGTDDLWGWFWRRDEAEAELKYAREEKKGERKYEWRVRRFVAADSLNLCEHGRNGLCQVCDAMMTPPPATRVDEEAK